MKSSSWPFVLFTHLTSSHCVSSHQLKSRSSTSLKAKHPLIISVQNICDFTFSSRTCNDNTMLQQRALQSRASRLAAPPTSHQHSPPTRQVVRLHHAPALRPVQHRRTPSSVSGLGTASEASGTAASEKVLWFDKPSEWRDMPHVNDIKAILNSGDGKWTAIDLYAGWCRYGAMIILGRGKGGSLNYHRSGCTVHLLLFCLTWAWLICRTQASMSEQAQNQSVGCTWHLLNHLHNFTPPDLLCLAKFSLVQAILHSL